MAHSSMKLSVRAKLNKTISFYKFYISSYSCGFLPKRWQKIARFRICWANFQRNKTNVHQGVSLYFPSTKKALYSLLIAQDFYDCTWLSLQQGHEWFKKLTSILTHNLLVVTEVLLLLQGAKDGLTFCALMDCLSKSKNDSHKTCCLLLYGKYMQKGNSDGQKSLALAKQKRSAWLHHNNFIIILK